MDRREFLRNTAAVGALVVGGAGLSPARAASDPFVRLDGTAQAELVARGEVTPLELVDATINRIEMLNPKLNAIVYPMFDRARELASSGAIPAGPFKGVPYAIKALSEIAGEPHTLGSKLFADNVGERDDGSVEKSKEAGFVIVARTNAPEFGLISTTESELLGAAHNPWDLERHTGGSSGGAAAAVASGMFPVAHAADGGGSIRIPASVCGLVGLKPSRGSMYTNRPTNLAADIGERLCISRTVRDTARVLDVCELKGDRPGGTPTGYVSGPSSRRLKIAYSTVNYRGDDADPEVKAALDATAQLCADLGHEIVEARPIVDPVRFEEHFLGVWASSPAKIVENAWLIGLSQWRWTSAEESLEPWTRGLAKLFTNREAANPGVVERAVAYIQEVTAAYDAYFQDVDVELTPVLRSAPVKLGEQGPDVAFDDLFERVVDYVSYTPQHNVAGTPAISLPLYTSSTGLPIGSQFAARHGRDRTLLELAYELEAARPWADRWAPHSAVNL